MARDATCLVRMCRMSESRVGDGKPVVTECGRGFHQVCLDTWVDESCTAASNTCPAGRAEMCQPRDREHVSLSDQDNAYGD